uniref:N-acetyltransferase domain-containing protein n=1 Tax=Panagrolaimus sp. ES5 TaxID=591445 RepID=A0AC34GQW4_9BILA
MSQNNISDEYDFIPLIRRQEYIEDCINLLNQEWPRSYAARENSLKRAMNEVPDLSLILLTKLDQKLIGHARICILPLNLKGCWVESVIIHDTLRGKGIGKILMQLIEEKAKELGYNEIYLSTEDKEQFYKRCGYFECAPLLNAGAASKLMKHCGLDKLLKPKISSNVLTSSTLKIPQTISSQNLPPPPPPPIQISKPQSKSKTYFHKKIQ